MTDRPRLLVATRSPHKLAELRDLLRLGRAELVDLDDVGIPDEVEETGTTFAANAALKARFYARRSGLPTLADDSGLEVDALDGGPGVRTRRYAGEQATDAQNNAKLLAALAGLPAGAPGRALPLRPGPGAARTRRPARRPARHADAGHARGPDRDRRHEGPTASATTPSSSRPPSRPAARPWPSGRPSAKQAVSHRARAARRMAPILAREGF